MKIAILHIYIDLILCLVRYAYGIELTFLVLQLNQMARYSIYIIFTLPYDDRHNQVD